MTDSKEARARKLQQRHHDLCALADGAGTTEEADTARTLARSIAKKMRALGWEPGALPPLVDETAIPGFEHLKTHAPAQGVATIEVHGHRPRPYKIAAPYRCPRCGFGRLTPYCPVCDVQAVEAPRGVLGDGPDGWS